MEQKLEAAAYSGNLTSLRQLLQEDALLLRRQASDGNPLHIAASLGYSEFVREVLAVNPALTCSRNSQGLTALHLAAVQGHLSVVKELLLACGDNVKQVCSAQDNKGFMPVHTAAVHGRIEVLKELLHTCPWFANSRTAEGDSIFHLAAKSNSFETVQFLLDCNEVITNQLLKSTNEKGNTTLHVAVARKQLSTVKLLLGREGVQVNARNKRGCTALDVLIESPAQHGDLVLGEQIRAAGGKTSAELQGGQAPVSLLQKDVESSSLTGSRPSRWRRWRSYWRINKEDHGIDGTEKYNNKPGTMMVVATLIATITFQAGLNPPGGFTQKNDSSPSPGASINEGQAVLGDHLSWFLAFDMTGLFLSLSIILLLICCAPRKKKMVLGFLKWILWLSVFFTALAFSVAVKEIFVSKPYIRIFLFCWFMLLSIFMVWVCFRVMRFLLRKGGCWKDKQSHTGPTKTVAIITKTVVGILLIILFWRFCWPNYARSNDYKIITFQAGLPGGFKQTNGTAPPPNDSTSGHIKNKNHYYSYYVHNEEGEGVLAKDLKLFLLFDMLGLFASLSIILLLICCVSRKNKMVMEILKWILWLAVLFTALAFSSAVNRIFASEHYARSIAVCWSLILYIFIAWLFLRAMTWPFRRCGCWKDTSQSLTLTMKIVSIFTKAVAGILPPIAMRISHYSPP